jgi:hypothetical protein
MSNIPPDTPHSVRLRPEISIESAAIAPAADVTFVLHDGEQ